LGAGLRLPAEVLEGGSRVDGGGPTALGR